MMSVPNNTVRTREFTFAFEPKTNPKTGSEEQVMDKIPEQHKIDYVKYLESVIAMSDKALKDINSIGVQPSVPWPRTETDLTGPKQVINEDVKLKGRNKPDQLAYELSCCLWGCAFAIAGVSVFLIGAVLGGAL